MTVHIDESQLDYYFEIRGIYDGWSIAVMKDGSLINRWPVDDSRHAEVQRWIESNWGNA